ncbi:MAG: hypothetical protein SPL30_02220 [Succinivibrio sp.]|jgi:chromosome segregation ATPase|nr:hypothetical protein [Succinivibrio sp.]
MKKQILCLPLCLAAMAFTLSACTADDCDPSSDPGFFTKIGCVTSGSYQKRIDNKKEHVKELRAEQSALTQEVIALNDENILVNEDRASAQNRLDRLNEELDALSAKVARSGKQSGTLKKQIAAAKAQVGVMKKMPEDATVLQKMAQKQKLQEELETLEQLSAAGY